MKISGKIAAIIAVIFIASACTRTSHHANRLKSTTIDVVQGMQPVVDATNIYSEDRVGNLSDTVKDDLVRIYVPNLHSNTVSVIDPSTMTVVDSLNVGSNPQHVVPSYDLKTLWVTNNAEGTTDGSLTPIDPKTGKAGSSVKVDDPYNMYFSPDGKSAIVVAEALHRLDFRDPHTMALQYSIDVPECAGINHADFSIDGKYMIASCEFAGQMVKIDLVNRKVVGYLPVVKFGMPQEVRLSPDAKTFYVAEMTTGHLFMIDGDNFTVKGDIALGTGTHGITFSRDGTKMFVTNRGFMSLSGLHPHGPGSVSVIDLATNKVINTWQIPGGGSPDMGNISADGKTLWVSGRYDGVVYAFDVATGSVQTITVGTQPHGLCVWPIPGRYSLGHTGLMR